MNVMVNNYMFRPVLAIIRLSMELKRSTIKEEDREQASARPQHHNLPPTPPSTK